MLSRAAALRVLVLTIATLMALQASPASALAVNPFFTGHVAVDYAHPLSNNQVIDSQLTPIFGQSSIYIDVEHGMVDDGGTLGGPLPASDFGSLGSIFDFSFWGPLVSNIDFSLGGQVTYGFPAAGVFAVSWVGVVNRDDNSIRNTFQVVFVGTSGFHTNGGFEIAPGSVVFAYGSPTDLHGTVNLSASSPAAIAIGSRGLSTLFSLGIGDANGVLSPADVAALQGSGDPFLFSPESVGFGAPVAFDSFAETVPEPSSEGFLEVAGIALLGLAGVGRSRS